MILFVEHGLYPPKLPPKQGCHDRMCISDKGTYSKLRYNTNDGPDVSWRQYGGAGITLTADLRSYISDKGGDPNKLGKWTWMSIEDKAEESTKLGCLPCRISKCDTFKESVILGNPMSVLCLFLICARHLVI